MVTKLLEKVAPAAVKAIGVPALLELIGVVSVTASVTNFTIDKTLGPVVEKGSTLMKAQITEMGEKKKAELEARKAALLAQKNEVIEAVPETEEKAKKTK